MLQSRSIEAARKMVLSSFELKEDYWETFKLLDQDIEFLYNHLIETETPLSSRELLELLIRQRIQFEIAAINNQRSAGCDIYIPKNEYHIGQEIVFPAQKWKRGKVLSVRQGNNCDYGSFEVILVSLDNGKEAEYAAKFDIHILNSPQSQDGIDELFDTAVILDQYEEVLTNQLESGLQENSDFVRIAGRWFPRALLVDINAGHLNLAEAILDMSGGGPLPTKELLAQIEIASNVNNKLLEFSLDLALQEDERFDEVGPAGEVLWHLKRLEPKDVLEVPPVIYYTPIDYSRSDLTDEMIDLEQTIDDEHSLVEEAPLDIAEVEVCLIYPHWRAGTLPLSSKTYSLFPTAYEAPRIRFTLVDGESQEKFPAWVVRTHGYIYGLKEWYEKRGLIPGSIVRINKSKKPGEVIIKRDSRRSGREWLKTVLVGSDGGVVFAMLKQIVQSNFDERMAIAIPDTSALDEIWEKNRKERPSLEKTVVNIAKELTKLNPQGHVHAVELYAAINVVRRCPPGPILNLLATRSWFEHVGDLHYRFSDTEKIG